MKYEIDGWNNFCRVFELPKEYPTGFCFGGGYPVEFKMVDWFNPVYGLPQPGVTKEVWIKEVGEIKTKIMTTDDLHSSIVPFLLQKQYVESGRRYLVLCDFGASIVFEAES
jgi:hypothetical protein